MSFYTVKVKYDKELNPTLELCISDISFSEYLAHKWFNQ